MEDIEIISMWKLQNEKIEQSLAINKDLLLEITNNKANSALRSLKSIKITGLILAVFYILFLGYLLSFAVSHYSPAWNYFLISVGAIFILNMKAIADYIRHLVWVNQIDYDGSITEIQQKLLRLQLSIIKHLRMMILQFPLFTTFYLSSNWFPGSVGWGYILLQTTLTGSFIAGTVWLYRKLRIENMENKVVQHFIAGSGGQSVRKAMEFYKEFEDFKMEE